MSFEQFISETLNNGISRDNRFTVGGAAVPDGLITDNLVQSVSLPGIQFHTGIYRNVGHGTRYINNPFYNEMTISFFDYEDMPVQKFYTTWINQIYNELGQIQYKDAYSRVLWVKKLTRKHETDAAITYNFEKVFPTNVSEVQLNQASVNTASLLTVTFSYDKWRIA
jgi:hypothetical protein